MNCVKYLLALVIFLLLLVRPIYSATLAVDVYGSYDYTNKYLSVFWKTNTVYTSFKIDFFTTFTDPTLACDTSPTLTLKASNTSSYSNKNITFTNVPDGKYRVNIYGVIGTTSTLILTQDFFIQAVSKNFTIGWCDSSTGNIGTNVYTTPIASFDFGSEEAVSSWKASELARSTNYFETKNMLFTYVYPSGISPVSAQVITYTVIPDKPIWKEIIN